MEKLHRIALNRTGWHILHKISHATWLPRWQKTILLLRLSSTLHNCAEVRVVFINQTSQIKNETFKVINYTVYIEQVPVDYS